MIHFLVFTGGAKLPTISSEPPAHYFTEKNFLFNMIRGMSFCCCLIRNTCEDMRRVIPWCLEYERTNADLM